MYAAAVASAAAQVGLVAADALAAGCAEFDAGVGFDGVRGVGD